MDKGLREASKIASDFHRRQAQLDRLWASLFPAIWRGGVPTGVTVRGWEKPSTRYSLIVHYAGKRKSFGSWIGHETPSYLSGRLRSWAGGRGNIGFSFRPSRAQMNRAIAEAEAQP
jgi:hypothetical protein